MPAMQAWQALFSEGARVVAVAMRPADGVTAVTAADEQGLKLEGFLTFADRPKADAGTSIAQLERLGIQVKIITGDNGLVAAKVCAEIGVDCTGVLGDTDVESPTTTSSKRRSRPPPCSPGSAPTRNRGSSR
jgi:Mg2+-importing ATPase